MKVSAGSYLLDTSVCSQPLKRQPVESALERWDQLEEPPATLEASLGEIEFGLRKLGSERRWLAYREVVLPSVRPLPVDMETWHRFARMKARQALIGRPVPDLDLLIAASAVRYDRVLATLDTRHFGLIEDLRWEDWSV